VSETRFRIPRMTMAVMVFGGLGCDSDEKFRASDTARIQKIADDECQAQFHCQDATHDATDYTTQQECVDHYVNKLTTELAKVTTDCKEASLEYYECYEALGCGGDPTKCAKQNATYETKCKDMLPATSK
jgi:hypothetical protein